MKKELKTFYAGLIIALIVVLNGFSQSTTNSYTSTLKFMSSDYLQQYEGLRIAVPTMTLPNSLTTYTSTLGFGSSDARQVYNAMRGVGDAISGYTASAWLKAGNTLATNTAYIGSNDNRSLLFKTNNVYRGKLDSNGVFDFRYNPAIFGEWNNGFQLQLRNGTNYLKFNIDTTVSNPNTQIFPTNGALSLFGSNSINIILAANDNISLGASNYTPTARVDIIAGNTTYPSLRLRAQSAVTTPTLGNLWYETTRGFLHYGNNTTIGTMSVSSTASVGGLNLSAGSLSVTSKVINTTSGDAATINSPTGRFRKDTSGTTFTLTNSFITANSIILITFASDPGPTPSHAGWVTAGAGSCTINWDAAPTNITDINFFVIN